MYDKYIYYSLLLLTVIIIIFLWKKLFFTNSNLTIYSELLVSDDKK
jgi:hypothetical protein